MNCPIRTDRFPDIRLVRLEGDRVLARDIEHFQLHFHDDCTLVNGLGATECGLVRQFFVDRHTSADPAEAVPVGYPVPDVAVAIVDDQGRAAGGRGAGRDRRREPLSGHRLLAESGADRAAVRAAGRRHPSLSDRRPGTAECRWLSGPSRPSRSSRSHRRRVHRHRRARAAAAIGGRNRAGGGSRLSSIRRRSAGSAPISCATRAAAPTRVCRWSLPATCARRWPHESGGTRFRPRFMFLDALPLTKDQKVDRGRLPTPARARPELPNDYVAPATALEAQMAQAWSEVLEIDLVGVTDSPVRPWRRFAARGADRQSPGSELRRPDSNHQPVRTPDDSGARPGRGARTAECHSSAGSRGGVARPQHCRHRHGLPIPGRRHGRRVLEQSPVGTRERHLLPP